MTPLSGSEEIREVSSHVGALNSNVVTDIFRQPLFILRDITSHVEPIQASTDVSTYITPIPIRATITVLESHSVAFSSHNLSTYSSIQNPSYCEVVK
ncbi:hypothetical protein J11TS1_10700 [Oceanobacillus sp. J11TS1]|nr:hypothetical protein J11TS1_10700 [Oceanobacillus sp. J11TS1]